MIVGLTVRVSSGIRLRLKKLLLSVLYNHIAELVLVPSTASKNFLLSVGVSERRIVVTPYVVDNDWISSVATAADRRQVRSDLGIPADAPVAVFCAKFITRKRPHDAIHGFARADVDGSYLVMV